MPNGDAAAAGGGESDSSDDVVWFDRTFYYYKKPPCDACGTPVNWKLQEHVDTVLDTLQNGKQVLCRYYYCAACKAKAWGCTEGEAQKRIIEEKPNFKKRMQWAKECKEKDAQTAVDFPAFDTKNKRRMITVVSFCEVIEDLFEFIEAKRRVFRKRGVVTGAPRTPPQD